MSRPVLQHTSFADDLQRQVRWLRVHRSPAERTTLRLVLARFKARISANPGLGLGMELAGTRSLRVFTIGGGLPYLIWYHYDVADGAGPVWLLMLRHEVQDRTRFTPEEFE